MNKVNLENYDGTVIEGTLSTLYQLHRAIQRLIKEKKEANATRDEVAAVFVCVNQDGVIFTQYQATPEWQKTYLEGKSEQLIARKACTCGWQGQGVAICPNCGNSQLNTPITPRRLETKDVL